MKRDWLLHYEDMQKSLDQLGIKEVPDGIKIYPMTSQVFLHGEKKAIFKYIKDNNYVVECLMKLPLFSKRSSYGIYPVIYVE